MNSSDEVLPSGHTVEIITGEEEKKLKKDFSMYTDGAIRFHPGRWLFPYPYLKYAPLVYNFEVKETDIFVVTFPKSGTTWMQEIIWNLVHNPDMDNPEANTGVDERFPNIECDMFLACSAAPQLHIDESKMELLSTLCGTMDYREYGIFIHLTGMIPDPRMIKSHLPLSLLPPNLLETCKVVYVIRDPRDVITSMYHYAKLQLLWGYRGSLDDFVDYVVNDNIHYGPFWSQLKEGWENRHHKNMCLIFYEDMIENIEREIRKVDKFLKTNRNDEQIKKVIHHTSFSQMKERTKNDPPSSNDYTFYSNQITEEERTFFRKGTPGEWKNLFTEQQMEKINAWIAKNIGQFGEDFRYKL